MAEQVKLFETACIMLIYVRNVHTVSHALPHLEQSWLKNNRITININMYEFTRGELHENLSCAHM